MYLKAELILIIGKKLAVTRVLTKTIISYRFRKKQKEEIVNFFS